MTATTETIVWFRDDHPAELTSEMRVADIAPRLQGQTLVLPNLQATFSRFPNEINPFYNHLKAVVDSNIEAWIDEKDVRMRLKAKKCDIALFSATWYPHATLDRLKTISWYTLFLFLWDDIIEAKYHPGDRDTVDQMQEQALRYMHYHLGLAEPSAQEPMPPTKYCTLFRHCALELRYGASLGVRKRFFSELSDYMDGCSVENLFVSSGTLPTAREYWEHRLGTSSLHTYGALNEYMCGGTIPEWMFATDELNTLWLELNRHVVVVNDIISLRKEVAEDSYHSLIPILMAEHNVDLPAAIMLLIESLQGITDNIDEAAKALVDMAENEDEETRTAVGRYVNTFRTNITGNYWWSLMCDRYGVTKFLQEDGKLVIPLGSAAKSS